MVTILETTVIWNNALGQPISVKEKFPLKQHPTTGKWGPSMHKKAKSKILFNSLGVNSFAECIGKEIVIVKKVSGINPNKKWLGFSI